MEANGSQGGLVCVNEILFGNCHDASALGLVVLVGERGDGPPVGFEKVTMFGHAEVRIEVGDHGARVSHPRISIKDKPGRIPGWSVMANLVEGTLELIVGLSCNFQKG